MNHPDDGTLEALVHGELEPAVGTAVEAHLTECVPCRTRLAEARENDAWVRERLGVLVTPVPHASAAQVRALSRRAVIRDAWRRAAMIGLLVASGSGVVLAMPSVRAWIGGLATQVGDPVRRPANQPVARSGSPVTSGGEGAPASPSGVSIVPGPRFVVILEATQEAGRLRVRESERSDVLFVTHGPPVRLETRSIGIRVYNAGAGSDYDIELPRAARDVDVRLGGESLFRRVGERWERSAADPDADGWRVVDLRAVRPPA